MKELTKRQKEILAFIKRYQEKNGVSPSVRDIAGYFNFSIKAAHDHLIALQKKKKIFRKDRISRNILLNEDEIDFNLKSSTVIEYNKMNDIKRKMKNIPKANECVLCGSKLNVNRHHEDYAKPHETIDLCRKHHLLWHRYKRVLKKIGYDVRLVKNT